MCFTKEESSQWLRQVKGKNGARAKMKWFHDHGYGNAGATSGHIVPGYERLLKIGWKGVYAELLSLYNALDSKERQGAKGAQLKAMMTSSTMARDLALKYKDLCFELSQKEKDHVRKNELTRMAQSLSKVPWEPATTFWEAVQALWINHMLVMTDENYPGAGVSFGRFDQYLWPYYQRSIHEGMDREFAKEILKCFWVHANTAYDAMIRNGNQGITAGFGQLITLSGLGADGKDMTNDLTYVILEVIDEMSPILEPKPNVRLHRNSPEELYDKVVDMIESSQGAPFLLNFDERSMAGMMLEAKKAGLTHLINKDNVHEYAPVGCLENTMVGNDRSGTVDNNLNLLKAVELAMTGGKDLLPFTDPMTGKTEATSRMAPAPEMPHLLKHGKNSGKPTPRRRDILFEDALICTRHRNRYAPVSSPRLIFPAWSKAARRQGKDVTQGGAEISFTTLEAVTYATTVDSLLAIKYLIFDKKTCTMKELVAALKANWQGYEILQATAKNRAPKYGRDDDEADALARKVMQLWCDETWRHSTKSTGRRYRPGMLSWNYWAGDGYIMAASADGRAKGQFLSNAICPSNGADIKGPTANANSVGKVLGGKAKGDDGDWEGYLNELPNGASHTITFNPSILRDPVHKDKFKAFLRGYTQNGGTALQINMLDPGMLKDAQDHPQNYRHLLVRITGYNAYFTTVGRELQNEVIERVSHNKF